MENQNKPGDILPEEKDRQIQLVLNTAAEEEDTIDLGNVIRNMKAKGRIYAWLLVLLMLAGLCVPLVMYQFTKPELTVSSLVTLRYEAPVKVEKDGKMVVPDNPEYEAVSDLSAPDGSDLDLGQITSSYVLQKALSGMELSQPVNVESLRGNIQIRTVLTEESLRTREALQGLAENKNTAAYTQLQEAVMKYENRFVVSLTNGFSDGDSRRKFELTDAELRELLTRVLSAYNDYLVRAWADTKLPEDAFSVIDLEASDILNSLEDIQSGLETLQEYCAGKSDTVRAFRSWQTGMNLEDWEDTLKTFRKNNVDYLYALVSERGMARDKASLLTGYRYQMREAQNDLARLNETIEDTRKTLKNYKNDEILVALQDSDSGKSSKAATALYNELVERQLGNYQSAARQKILIGKYENLIQRLEAAGTAEVTDEVEAGLSDSLVMAKALYTGIRNHMEELFESPMYSTYEEFSAPQGKTQNFLSASLKKMVIGAALGAVIALGLWLLAGLVPEFGKSRKETEKGGKA